jgi:hypothetical protein
VKLSDIPAKFPIPFAFSAGAPTFRRPIPLGSQIGIQDGAASLTDGYPPLTFTPQGAGGVPPFGADMNGILFESTSWDRWFQAGGIVPYDATFQAGLLPTAGYPKGAVVASAATDFLLWVSLVDDNTSNPDAGGSNWAPFSYLGGASTGDFKLTFKAVADPGWILINDGSIGSAASGATFASALALPAYTVAWTNISQSFAIVAGGRGANPTADFNANKPMTLPRLLGRALAVAGAGSGLSARSLGQWLGEETHILTLAELASHTHIVRANQISVPQGTGVAVTVVQALIGGGNNLVASESAGGDAAHNNMQPSGFLNAEMKL